MKLIKGRIYEIRYIGSFGYDSYSGKGIFTGGKTPESMGLNDHFEFEMSDKTKGFFPINDVFDVKE